ncbi:MLP-like protein 34 [Cucurbita pepo subsp. pepo]|uniref:MLP-like protein 34 n=1 Tax=Cucurbita pepo subsp. pepo TaxID=3664 RepID=UPI000C9D7A2B|nr:MLP-like protein 34 [Cucurbita pepo subsp. pepo]
MSQSDSIWGKVQLKSSPEKFYGFFRNHMGELVHMFPDHFQSFHFLEGQNFDDGSVVQWKYHLGFPEAAKVRMRVMDEARTIIYEVVEGDALKHYKAFRVKLETVSGDLNKVGANFAKWTIEYEKAHQNVASPETYLELALQVTKGLDAYLYRNKMSQSDSIWGKVQLKSSPEKFYGFFRNHMGELVHMFPDHFQSFHFLEGQNFDDGSVVQWKYHLGFPEAAKVRMRVMDEARTIIYEVVEGDALKHYKAFRVKLETVSGDLNKVGANFAKWTIEYEKAHQNVASPETYLELALQVTKGLDAYLYRN